MREPSQTRLFSIEEANALVPKLDGMVGAQLALATEIQQLVGQLGRRGHSRPAGEGAEVVDVTVYPDDSLEVQDLKRELAKQVQHYRAVWREVQGLGVVIKDPVRGLLDFYGRIDDRLVCLCWRYGEPGVDHYHDLDAGFSARKPLDEVRPRMLN